MNVDGLNRIDEYKSLWKYNYKDGPIKFITTTKKTKTFSGGPDWDYPYHYRLSVYSTDLNISEPLDCAFNRYGSQINIMNTYVI